MVAGTPRRFVPCRPRRRNHQCRVVHPVAADAPRMGAAGIRERAQSQSGLPSRHVLPDQDGHDAAVQLVAVVQAVGRALGVDVVHHVEEGGRVRLDVGAVPRQRFSSLKTTMPTYFVGPTAHSFAPSARWKRSWWSWPWPWSSWSCSPRRWRRRSASGGCGAWRSGPRRTSRPASSLGSKTACSPSRTRARAAAPIHADDGLGWPAHVRAVTRPPSPVLVSVADPACGPPRRRVVVPSGPAEGSLWLRWKAPVGLKFNFKCRSSVMPARPCGRAPRGLARGRVVHLCYFVLVRRGGEGEPDEAAHRFHKARRACAAAHLIVWGPCSTYFGQSGKFAAAELRRPRNPRAEAPRQDESGSNEKLHRRWGGLLVISSRRGPTASAAATRRPRGARETLMKWLRGRQRPRWSMNSSTAWWSRTRSAARRRRRGTGDHIRLM